MDDLSRSKIVFEDEFSYLEKISSTPLNLLYQSINPLGSSIVGVLDKCYVLDISKKLIEGVYYIQS